MYLLSKVCPLILGLPSKDTLELKGYLTVTGQSYIHIPYGITANRPAGGPVGSLRVNTTTGNLEFFNGTDWGSV